VFAGRCGLCISRLENAELSSFPPTSIIISMHFCIAGIAKMARRHPQIQEGSKNYEKHSKVKL
jgi:hypothetical protein